MIGHYIWLVAVFVSLMVGTSVIITCITSAREVAHYNHVNNRLDTIRDTNYLMEIKGNTVTIHWPSGESETVTKRDSESDVLFGQRISDLIDGKLTGDF